MSQPSWKILEGYLEKIALRCGFRYLPASTGDSQGGGDGGGKLIIEKFDFYWKFESKHRISTFMQPVQMGEIAKKILDIMSQDNRSWPEVLCLLTPHHVLSDQLERKINVLEKNGRIPFKVVIWDYRYILGILTSILDSNAIANLYPKITITPEKNPDLLLAKFISDIENRTREGLFIKNSYIHAEDHDHHTLTLTVKRREIQIVGGREEVYDFVLGVHTFRIAVLDVDKLALKKVPIGVISNTPLPQSVAGVSQVIIKQIETVDWGERFKDIDGKKTEIINIFKTLKRKGGVSLYDEFKVAADTKKVIVKIIGTDMLLGLVPFVYLTHQDFGFQNQIAFVQVKEPIL